MAKRRTPRKVTQPEVEALTESIDEALEEVEAQMNEELPPEDRFVPIVKSGGGLRMGVNLYLPEGDIAFKFFYGRKGGRAATPADFQQPLAVKVTQEGGSYHRVEFFYSPDANQITFGKFDNKTLVLQTGLTEDGRPKGRLFKGLTCTGRLRDSLPEFPDLRLEKYVCFTQSEEHFESNPTHLKGLAAPHQPARARNESN